jgi:hypothetical protein
VKNCQDLANLAEHKRRSLLNTVDDAEYSDIITVLSMMPSLEIEPRIEGLHILIRKKKSLKINDIFSARRRRQRDSDGWFSGHFESYAQKNITVGCEKT